MNKISEVLDHKKTVAISGHMRPDGDCIGSCMGIFHYIRENYPDIQVDVYLEEISSVFNYIKNVNSIKNTYENHQEYDLFISLDCAEKERLGNAVVYFDNAKETVCIDHHISNTGYADTNYIYPQASSASELVYELLDEDKISKNIAAALYTGIIHDTGVFQYSCTSDRTMTIAGKLMATGIPFTQIVENSFYKKSFVQNQMLGRVLLESILLLEGTCIAGIVSQQDMDFYNATAKDLDGIVSQLKYTEGVEVAIFLYQISNLEYKVSLRSTGKVDVNEVASYFNGGGHVLAAGCTFHGTYRDALMNIAGQIEKQL
jgi:Exopolyphosphatase-related proteins